MMGHKICFYEESLIIIPKLSLLLILIWSPVEVLTMSDYLGNYGSILFIVSNT